MQNIFEVAITDLGDLFTQTALKMGMGLPSIIEKDYWLVKTLQFLFSDEHFFKNHVFKGGTSLSKCYDLIQRFSEDVDITISREHLGFKQGIEEVATLGNKRRKRYFDELKNAAEQHVEKIVKRLSEHFQKNTEDSNFQWYVDPHNKQQIIFEYPKSLALSMYPDDSYVKPKIVLEFGCRGGIVPSRPIHVTAYIETTFDEIFSKSNVLVNSLDPERTFWEKITLLHMLAHQPEDKPLRTRMARHYYDVYMLSQSEVTDRAIKNIHLLKTVTTHNSIFFRSKQASYETAKSGSLKMVPNQLLLQQVASDYKAMEEMFFGGIVPFTKITSALKALENKLNNPAEPSEAGHLA